MADVLVPPAGAGHALVHSGATAAFKDNANPDSAAIMDQTDADEQEEEERTGVQTTAARSSAAGQSRRAVRSRREVEQPNSRVEEMREGDVAEDEDDEEELIELKYGAQHVIYLFVPISLCMAAVVLTMTSVGYYKDKTHKTYMLYTPFVAETDNPAIILLQSVGNALVILCVVIVMTTVLILLYKFKFYRVIHGWLVLSSLLLLSLFTLMYLMELFKSFNQPVDYITVLFVVWNWAMVGMICIHWKGPLLLQQGYLIVISALMALIFIKFLPEWTAWTVLGVISLWDLVAVLCPKGPLRILVETAQERNEPIFPALIYSSGVLYNYALVGMADEENVVEQEEPQASADSAGQKAKKKKEKKKNTGKKVSGTIVEGRENPTLVRNGNGDDDNGGFDTAWLARREAPPRQLGDVGEPTTSSAVGRTQQREVRQRQNVGVPRQNDAVDDDEQRGIKLGLGDFIFYSVLVGKASSYGDWNTTFACYVSILIGLCGTLILLAVFKKALPALPCSIACGLVFYFSTSYVISPFTNALSSRMILL